MKQFFKILFGSCLGTILALSLIGLVFIVVVTVSGMQKEELDKKSVLKLKLNESIPELTGNVAEEQFSFDIAENIGLRDIKKVIRQAAKDDKIEGIYLNTNKVYGGQATLKEIREELEYFKESGKFIWAYADYYSQGGYWMASVADSVFLNPNGFVELKGFGASLTFYKNFMDKLGVDMNIFYAGKYKSATEPYRRKNISPENREQIKAFLNDMYDVMLTDISKTRNLSVSELKEITDKYLGGYASTAQSSGLVDEQLYWADFENRLKKKIKIKEKNKVNYINLSKYKEFLKSDTDYKVKDKIAIVYAEGVITNGNTGKGTISDVKYNKIFEKIEKDKNIKAVVLRVNSPGGNSLDSDNLNQKVLDLKEAGKPVIASYGDYAASGGYYISANCDSIVAEANTLTGSIGVFLMFPNVSDLLEEKLGIHHDTVKTSPMAVSFSSVMDLTDQEKTYLQNYTDELYQRFVQIVANGRGMTVEEVDKIAQGRVWTGKRAKELGLVDIIGGVEEATQTAAKAAGLENYRIVTYPKIKENPYEKLIKELISEEAPSVQLSTIEEEFYQYYQHIQSFTTTKQPQARLPYLFHWN